MFQPYIWRPSSTLSPTSFLPEAQLPPPAVPPKPSRHVHSNVTWRPPSRTFAEEEELARNTYAPRTASSAGPSQTVHGDSARPKAEEESTRVTQAYRRMQMEERYPRTFGRGLGLLVTRTWLNILFVFVPLEWISHFLTWSPGITFAFGFVAIIPLQLSLNFVCAQLGLLIGVRWLSLLTTTTLNNTAPAALIVILLVQCEIRLAQATVAGVLLVQLLVMPGLTLLISQSRVVQSRLSHALLSIGVLSLLALEAFFTASYTVTLPAAALALLEIQIQQISRGMAIILIVVYIGSRLLLPVVFSDNTSYDRAVVGEDAGRPLTIREEEEPVVPTWLCILAISVFMALLIVTVLWLVDSFTFIAGETFSAEWFGLILLPFSMFGADVLVSIVYVLQSNIFQRSTPLAPRPSPLAVDLCIQFLLLWLPIVVLLGWILSKPMTLLFDLYEVVLLIGVLYLSNGQSTDLWIGPAEGLLFLSAYVIIALCSWFYGGQAIIQRLEACTT